MLLPRTVSRILLTSFFFREPVTMVMTDKADGVLAGMAGRYASTAAGFR